MGDETYIEVILMNIGFFLHMKLLGSEKLSDY